MLFGDSYIHIHALKCYTGILNRFKEALATKLTNKLKYAFFVKHVYKQNCDIIFRYEL